MKDDSNRAMTAIMMEERRKECKREEIRMGKQKAGRQKEGRKETIEKVMRKREGKL